MAERRPKQTPAQQREEQVEWWIKTLRSVLLFLAGLGLTIHEGLSNGPERPSFYVLWAGMMGLGPVLAYAEAKAKERSA